MYVHLLPADEGAPTPVYFFARQDPSAPLDLHEVQDAIRVIKSGTKRALAAGPDGVEWKGFSYMVFVLEDANQELKPGGGVTFEHGTPKTNHTFFKGQDFGTFGPFSAVACINFRLDENGQPLGYKREQYRWRAHHHASGHPIRIMTHTDSGTNTGP